MYLYLVNFDLRFATILDGQSGVKTYNVKKNGLAGLRIYFVNEIGITLITNFFLLFLNTIYLKNIPMKQKLLLLLLSTLPLFSKELKKQHYYEFERDGKLGKVNHKGQIVIPAIYDNFGEEANGLFPAKLNDKYGVIDSNNKIIIPFKYEYVDHIKGNLIEVSLNDKYGWVNLKNKVVIPIIYDSTTALNDGTFLAVKNDKTGLIDKNGKTIIDFKYPSFGLGDAIQELGYSENKIVFEKDGKYGYLDQQQKEIIAPTFDRAYSFHNGYAIAVVNKLYGIIDTSGKFVIEPSYSNIYYYKGFYETEKDNNEGFINSNLKEILPAIYDEVEFFSEGLAVVEKNKKYGLINENGEFVIPLMYDGAHECSEGLIPVLKDNYWGFVDTTNKTVIEFWYSGNMYSFKNGYANYHERSFSSMGKYTSEVCGLIDKKGKMIIKPKYKDISYVKSDGCLIVEKDGKDYLIDLNDEQIFELKATELTPTIDSLN